VRISEILPMVFDSKAKWEWEKGKHLDRWKNHLLFFI